MGGVHTLCQCGELRGRRKGDRGARSQSYGGDGIRHLLGRHDDEAAPAEVLAEGLPQKRSGIRVVGRRDRAEDGCAPRRVFVAHDQPSACVLRRGLDDAPRPPTELARLRLACRARQRLLFRVAYQQRVRADEGGVQGRLEGVGGDLYPRLYCDRGEDTEHRGGGVLRAARMRGEEGLHEVREHRAAAAARQSQPQAAPGGVTIRASSAISSVHCSAKALWRLRLARRHSRGACLVMLVTELPSVKAPVEERD